MLVGYCKGDAYRVFMSQNGNVIETKDVSFGERFEMVARKEKCDEFDMYKSGVIVDDMKGVEAGPETIEPEPDVNNEIDDVETRKESDARGDRHLEKDNQTEVVEIFEEALEALTYYLSLRRSSRNTKSVA